MPEQRKRLHGVAELTLSTRFLLASEVPAIAAFARSGLPQARNFKTRQALVLGNPKRQFWSCAFQNLSRFV